MKTWIVPLILIALTAAPARATFEGVSTELPIRRHSRPCCAFIPNFFTRIVGLSGFTDPQGLGEHDFADLGPSKSEKSGMLYTCRGGFIDLSHLRDNADWAAQIYLALREKVGTGVSIALHRESGVESLTLELPRLSDDQRAAIGERELRETSTALAFDLALLHEIATSFPMAVSGKPIPFFGDRVFNERNSSFSVEDSYSNLLGAHLGMQAGADPERPFNAAMTRLLDLTLSDLGALPPGVTRRIFKSLKGDWWKPGFYRGYKQMRRREFAFEGTLDPVLPETTEAREACGIAAPQGTPELHGLAVPAANPEVAFVRLIPNSKYRKNLSRLGIEIEPGEGLTRARFDSVITKIRERFSRRIPGFATTPPPPTAERGIPRAD